MQSSADRRFAIAGRVASCRAASIAAALGWLLAVLTGSVNALGLGEIVEQSSLGEPLRFAIPVLVNADDLDELAPECFKLVPGESARSGELPQMTLGRAALERNAAGVRVVVSSRAIATEPALSFTVQAGCRVKLRHEYTVLLDPPIIREPMAVVEATVSSQRAVSAAVKPSAETRTSSSRAGARSKRPGRAEGAVAANRTTSTAGAARRTPPAKQPAPVAKDDGPRLSVSRSTHDSGPGAGSDVAQGKSDEEIRREVEAETVVLQRRIAELSTTLERMEAELRAATAARDAAERTAKAAPPAPPGPDAWLVSLALVIALLALTAVLIRMRRASSLAVPAFASPQGAIEEDAPAGLTSDTAAAPRYARHAPATAATLAPVEQADAHPEEEDAFEEDLLSYAEQRSVYSTLEREQPKVVAAIVRDWGNPKVIAYLRELLVSPRKGSRPFSPDAVSDLIFLQSLAMEHAGYGSQESPWQIELGDRQKRIA